MKLDPFAPQLLIDYDWYCRRKGEIDFRTYMLRWYAVTELLENAENNGLDPFQMTAADFEAACPSPIVN